MGGEAGSVVCYFRRWVADHADPDATIQLDPSWLTEAADRIEALEAENQRLKKALGQQTDSVRRWKNLAGVQRRKAKRRLSVLRDNGLEPPDDVEPPDGVVVTTDGRYFADLQTSGMPDGWRFVQDAAVRSWVEVARSLPARPSSPDTDTEARNG